MRERQPNPELMLDSKTHSRARNPKTRPLPNDIYRHFPEQAVKVVIQLSIFPTATLTFVILNSREKPQCTWPI
jgi:hypothetical protein